LPLDASVKKIAIMGPLADSIPALEGSYNGASSHYVTPVDGIRKQFPSAQVTYTPGMNAGSDLQVDVDVRNTSEVAGDEVVQAYLVFPKLPGAPLRALRGFERVNIGPGRTQQVRLTLNARGPSMVNEEGTRLVAAGDYQLFIGGGQPGTGAPGAELPLKIQGEQKLPR
jgi:hypothetical protein